MAVVKQNRTRYNTDDILALLGWFEKKMHNLGLVQAGELELGWRAQQVALWRPPSEGINLGSVSPQEVVLGECVSFNHSKLPQGWRRKGGLPCLKIIAPKNLPDDDPGRALLMAAKDIRPHLPDSGAREVLRWYYAAGTMSHEKIRDHGQTVLDLIKTTPGLPPVFADNRIATQAPRGDYSKAAKVQRYREHFGDSTTAMGGSSKTPAYHWKSALWWAKEYYEREFERREKWRQKILDLGEFESRHTTFEEFLIDCAARLKDGRGLPRS